MLGFNLIYKRCLSRVALPPPHLSLSKRSSTSNLFSPSTLMQRKMSTDTDKVKSPKRQCVHRCIHCSTYMKTHHLDLQAWTGEGMSQEDFMYKDECIVLNENDENIGHDNKWVEAQSTKKLHTCVDGVSWTRKHLPLPSLLFCQGSFGRRTGAIYARTHTYTHKHTPTQVQLSQIQ